MLAMVHPSRVPLLPLTPCRTARPPPAQNGDRVRHPGGRLLRTPRCRARWCPGSWAHLTGRVDLVVTAAQELDQANAMADWIGHHDDLAPRFAVDVLAGSTLLPPPKSSASVSLRLRGTRPSSAMPPR